jgi:sialate O-acetylesterase
VHGTDVTWFNGALLGCTQIKGAGRTYVVDGRLVRPGKNLLTVAVLNREGPGGLCAAPTNLVLLPPTGSGKDRPIRLAGTWKVKAGPAFKDLRAPFPTPKVGHYQTVPGMYNGMIAPLAPFAIKGAVWYQGESNGPRWLQYRRLLPTLIADWRELFQVGDFPFLIVGLPNYNAPQTKPVEPGWAEIRESQWRTARTVHNTGLVTTIDVGESKDIHPRNKPEVGRRLSLLARALVYGEKHVVYSGPEFSKIVVEKGRARLHFKHVHGGLVTRPGGGKLAGFAIAGADRKFVWADAVIDGDTVVVSSPAVPEPRHVRYGWAWSPIGNLYNREGLPAITFRTDE